MLKRGNCGENNLLPYTFMSVSFHVTCVDIFALSPAMCWKYKLVRLLQAIDRLQVFPHLQTLYDRSDAQATQNMKEQQINGFIMINEILTFSKSCLVVL